MRFIDTERLVSVTLNKFKAFLFSLYNCCATKKVPAFGNRGCDVVKLRIPVPQKRNWIIWCWIGFLTTAIQRA